LKHLQHWFTHDNYLFRYTFWKMAKNGNKFGTFCNSAIGMMYNKIYNALYFC